MAFQYRVRDPLGGEHHGTIDAKSRDDAQQQLRRDGLQVLHLEEDDEGSLFPRRVKKAEIIYATTQLAIMVDTGITLSVALESICEQEENPTLRRVLMDLKKAVESGEDFSHALEKYPKYFDRTYIALVRSSEATGTLGEMLDRIAGYLRKELETRGKVKASLAYPTVMGTLAVAVTIFLLTYILPKFEPLFSRKGAQLPGITVLMMSISRYLIDYWYLWLAGIASLVGGIVYGKQTARGRQVFDYLKINLPVFGPMFRKVTISRSVRTLGTLVASGVSMLEAIRLSAEVAGNYYYEQLWNDVLEDVTAGNQIYQQLARSPLFPSMLVQMVRSGEETGKLDVVLEKVSNYYDGEVEMSLKTTTSLIEPVMITGMGFLVGGIAIGLLLPIFTMSRQ